MKFEIKLDKVVRFILALFLYIIASYISGIGFMFIPVSILIVIGVIIQWELI